MLSPASSPTRRRGAAIRGLGMAVPATVLANHQLEELVATSDEWIVTRTGIRERRIARDGETTSALAAKAARDAIADAQLEPDEIDMILCATCTGDYLWPATACIVQDAIGSRRAAAFDISAACAGFCYGVEVAAALIESGKANNIVLIGADTLTRHVDWSDRSTCVLFGDGAAAVVLRPSEPAQGVLGSSIGADGSHHRSLFIPAGGTQSRLTPALIAARYDKLVMRGGEVFKFAVRIMGEACLNALAEASLSADDVDLFIPHQANIRIINAAATRMGLPPEKVFCNLERYGNTSAASVPIALFEAAAMGRIKDGDIIVLVGFGAGLTWGANVIRWERTPTSDEAVL